MKLSSNIIYGYVLLLFIAYCLYIVSNVFQLQNVYQKFCGSIRTSLFASSARVRLLTFGFFQTLHK